VPRVLIKNKCTFGQNLAFPKTCDILSLCFNILYCSWFKNIW